MSLNSPGLWPTACQILGKSSSVPPDCSLWVLDSSSGVQKDTIYGVLGRGLGFNCVGSNSGIEFLSRSKINPEIDAFFMDFGSQNRPQIHLQIIKHPFPKPSRNHTPKNNTTHAEPNPAKP